MKGIPAKVLGPPALMFALLFPGVPAAETLVLNADESRHNPAPAMQYFSSAGALTPREAASSGRNWSPLKRPFFHHERSQKEFWFRLELRNESETEKWYLSILSNRLDHVDLYFLQGGEYRVMRNGDFAEWKAGRSAPYPVFSLRPPRGRTAVYYLRVRSDTMLLSFEPLLAAPRAFGARRALERGLQVLFLVMAGIYLLYCGCMLYFRRNSAYLYLMLLAISFSMYSLTLIGDANLVLWNSSAYLRNVMTLVWALGTILFFLLFGARLLQTRDQFPILHWVVRLLTAAGMLYFPLIFLDISNHVLSPMLIGIQLSSIAVVLIASIRVLLLRRWYVLWFLASWGILMLGGAAHGLMLLGVLEYNFLTAYAGFLASPLEFLTVTVAVAARYRRLVREKEELLREFASANPGSTGENNPTRKRTRNLDAERIINELEQLAGDEGLFYRDRVSLESTAKRLGLRPDQLSAILNSELNVSFNDLVNNRRLEFARRLLVERPELNVLEIAFMTGFGSRTNFNRVFKRSTGMAPLEYRRANTREEP